LARRLAGYGCTEFIPLDEKLSTPAQLDYLDLLPTRSDQTTPLTAVAEHQGTALLYLVDACGDSKLDDAMLADVRRRLANRSDPAWFGVVRAGSLEIFPIGFHEAADTQPVETIHERSETAPFFFQSLVHGTFERGSKPPGTNYIYRKIFDLLTQTTDRFVPQDGTGRIDALEVLSMAGRALFVRFLIDRDIVRKNELFGTDGICPAATDLKDAFSTAEKAAQTSAWLDATFNGDFLPLIDESIPLDDRAKREAAYLRFYKRMQRLVGKRIFTHLHAILRGWRDVGGGFQTEFDWGDLDFAHIPVGVLSQVYESFSHRADPRTARETSVHYTPRTIASLMVDQAFAAVEDPADAKVLDSSCGAGIFMVLAFRRLVRERWANDKKRPNTAAIQDILYNQLCGFDISESALRLAALSLYITAIELNASQRPPHALKFPRNLRGEVLHRFGDQDVAGKEAAVFPLGSLGPEVPSEFDKTFDIVIGNPPWTPLRHTKKEGEDATETKKCKAAITALNNEFTKIGRRVLETRGVDGLSSPYVNPNNNPDLPFLWRATEWAKPDGVIALAMPARLFGRTTGNGFKAWRAILRSVEVTGLINGADLRWSSVWKDIKMPFCMFFARNATPKPEHRFYYASPLNEPDLNGEGRFRIDYEVAHPISAARVEEQPWLLKTLSLGTWLDVELMESLSNADNETLDDRWIEWDAARRKTGKGYDRSPGQKQDLKEFLVALPVFERPKDSFSIDFSVLRKYGELFGVNSEGQSSAHMPRRKELYQPPLVIVPEAPGDNPLAPRAFISRRSVAFSKSYYGYSCAGHPEAETLAAFIYLLPHSTLFSYFCLMTSRRSGFDRQTFNKQEFDALPFPDIAGLSTATKSRIRSLAQQLQENAKKPWREIDEFIFELYGLDAHAVQVAEDTLFFAASYRRAGRAALECTTHDTRADFVTTVRESLEPYFDVCGEHIAVREATPQGDTWREPWFFLSVSREAETVKVNPNLMRKAMKAANQRGCSRIIVHAPKRSGLLLGLLNQRRWWTITRARLCAQHIIRERLGACGLPEDA
jgi:hypothetical protein